MRFNVTLEISMRTGEDKYTVEDAIKEALEQELPAAIAKALGDDELAVDVSVDDIADADSDEDDEDEDDEDFGAED